MMASNSRVGVSASSVSPPRPLRGRGKSTDALMPARRRAKSRAMLQEILQQRMAVFRGDAFGMKLHAMHGMGLVHHALDHAVFAWWR